MIVITSYGVPIQEIVKAFGLEERTVRDWWQRSGRHCQAVHEHAVAKSRLDLQQADEIKPKGQDGHFWMALAMMLPTRLWLGGVVSEKRNLTLIQALTDKAKGIALCRPLLLAVDGLASYVAAFRSSFRPAPSFGRIGPSKADFLAEYCHCPGRQTTCGWPSQYLSAYCPGQSRDGAIPHPEVLGAGRHQHRFRQAPERNFPPASQQPGPHDAYPGA